MNLPNASVADIQHAFLTIQQANQLKSGNQIDHRDRYGLFRKAAIIDKSGTNLKIHYNDLSKEWDLCCDYQKEIHRFAKIGAISQRSSHRFKQLEIGDYINVNPPFRQTDCEWKTCKIIKMDDKSGQFQVHYEHQNKTYSYWFHVDNVKEVEWFNINSDIMNQLSKFGYSNDEIVSAMNKAVNKNDINSIMAIIQQHEEQQDAINTHDADDDEKDDQPHRRSTIITIGTEKNEKKDQNVSGQSPPTEPTLAPATEINNFKIHIAIDFGTDGVALAYLINNESHIHTEWATTKVSVKVKPKTIILLDENNDTISFGEDAKYHYMGMPKMKDKWMLFERFKMALYEDEPGNGDDNHPDLVDSVDNDDEHKESRKGINDELIASNGKRVKAGIVFVAAFKYLQKEAKKYLERSKLSRTLFKKLKHSDYQWIITVPAIWNDEAKYKMRQWTIDAGLVDPNIENQCKIVYEPDCAALSIQREIYSVLQASNSLKHDNDDNNDDSEEDNDDDEKYDEEENKNIPYFQNGDKYILVDAGGGTVDIACHEMISMSCIQDFGVKEIHHPSGGPWGSYYIDDHFVKLLHDIFSDDWMNEFKQEQPQNYLKLLHNFQKSKVTFYNNPQSHVKMHNVRLGTDFVAFMQDKIEEVDENEDVELEDFVQQSKVFGQSNLVSLADEFLEINVRIWEVMFDHVIDPTVQHIHKLLNTPKLKNNCKYLCLVGGLSTSKYFQYRMEQEFGPISNYKLTLITPMRPILSVVDGAAYFGITRNYIKARILRYTYGETLAYSITKAISQGIPLEHINQNRYYDEIDQKTKVNGCFKVIARKNEEFNTGDIRYSRSKKDRTMDKISSKRILCSNLEFPKVKIDGRVIGNIVTEFDEDDELHIGMTLEFHFYDTIIKVISYRNDLLNIKQTHFITNYA